MAASILSFGMFTARAFWMVRRSVGLEAGSVPPDLTAIVMSLAMRANCFAMRFHRANIVCFLTSKMRPMAGMVHERKGGCQQRQVGTGRWIGPPKRPQAALRPIGLHELRLQQPHA